MRFAVGLPDCMKTTQFNSYNIEWAAQQLKNRMALNSEIVVNPRGHSTDKLLNVMSITQVDEPKFASGLALRNAQQGYVDRFKCLRLRLHCDTRCFDFLFLHTSLTPAIQPSGAIAELVFGRDISGCVAYPSTLAVDLNTMSVYMVHLDVPVLKVGFETATLSCYTRPEFQEIGLLVNSRDGRVAEKFLLLFEEDRFSAFSCVIVPSEAQFVAHLEGRDTLGRLLSQICEGSLCAGELFRLTDLDYEIK